MRLSLCSTEYKYVDTIPTLHLFCRDINGKRFIIKDPSFLPYFYIWEGDYQLLYEYFHSKKPDPNLWKGCNILKTPISKARSIDNRPLRKIVVDKPTSVRVLRKELKKKGVNTFEADVLFPLRYLIDKGIKSGIDYDADLDIIKPFNNIPSNLKTIFIDIEVLARKIPDLKDSTSTVCAVGIYDTLEKRYYLLYLLPPGKIPEELDLTEATKREPKNIALRYFYKEKNLLYNFLDLLKSLEPDVILTFTTFDILYLINRCKNLGINYRRMSPLYVVATFKNERIRVSGIQCLDLAEMYRKAIGQLKWETLEAVSQRELGYGRIYHKEQVPDMFFDTVRLEAGCNLSDTMYSSRIADVMYLREVFGKVVLPSKTTQDKIPYAGAIVFDSKKGIYDNILVIDFNAMYPTIIDTFNISYDTYSKKGKINIDNKYRFKKNPKGWTPIIMRRLRPIRDKIKNNLKNIKDKDEYRRQKATSDGYKAIINALYGLYGYAGNKEKGRPASRLYKVEIAECITYLGRTILEEGVIPSLNKLGYEVVYGDTDSIFIKLKNSQSDEATVLLSQVNDMTTKFIKDRWNVDSTMQLDVDKIFKRLILFGVKKKYKGKTLEGKIIVKGLEQIRRDSAEITSDVQETIGELVLDNKPKEDVVQYLSKVIKKYRTYPLTYISIPKRLSKMLKDYKGIAGKVVTVTLKSGKKSKRKIGIPESVKAFLRGRERLGEELEEGERFYLIHTLVPEKVRNRVNKKQIQTSLVPVIKLVPFAIGYKNPDSLIDEVDYDKMLRLTVKDKINPLLELLEIGWGDINGKD